MATVPRGFTIEEGDTSTLTCESCDRYFRWGPGHGYRIGIESMPHAIGFAAAEHTKTHDLERRVDVLEQAVRGLLSQELKRRIE